MKVGIYPGSFNPWHEGHQDVIDKASKVFDVILIAKYHGKGRGEWRISIYENGEHTPAGYYLFRKYNLPDLIRALNYYRSDDITAVIRGLRNGNDLQYEQNMLYTYEDLGLEIPITYFLCNRELGHISSTMKRLLKGVNDGEWS